MGKALAILNTPVIFQSAGAPPDNGFITIIMQQIVKVNGIQVATVGSICNMVNSLTGTPYSLPIPPGGSSGVKILGQQVVRMGDVIPTGSGVLTILPFSQPVLTDGFPP
ncbi:MAG: hypothetical protein PVI43_02075 [Candidatus Bathyarchaeota archaeon]|jgi:uncharacterized Zn-binding protein involved in type VI secretion